MEVVHPGSGLRGCSGRRPYSKRFVGGTDDRCDHKYMFLDSCVGSDEIRPRPEVSESIQTLQMNVSNKTPAPGGGPQVSWGSNDLRQRNGEMGGQEAIFAGVLGLEGVGNRIRHARTLPTACPV